MKSTGVLLLTTTVLMAYTVSAAGAADKAANVTGRWSGYFDRFDTRGVSGAVSILISSQDGRRLAGEICFPPAPCTPVAGTIAQSGEITMTGRSAEVQNIEVHGSPFDRRTGFVSTIVGDYHVARAEGADEQGRLFLVHQASEGGLAADVAGAWGGQGTPLGTAAARPVELILEVDRVGAITGRLAWETAEAQSELVGQAMRTNGADEIAIVGRLNDSIFVANLTPSVSVVGASQSLQGNYGLYSNARPQSLERGTAWLYYASFAPTKQSEAVANLKAMYTAEKAYLQEKDAYSTKINVVGFSPERNNRYRYVLTADPVSLEGRSGTTSLSSPTDEGIDADLFKYPLLIYPKITSGPCVGTPVWGITEGPVFTGAAYGNIDGDDTLDVWTISTAARWLSGSGCDAVGYVPAGEPANERNDINK